VFYGSKELSLAYLFIYFLTVVQFQPIKLFKKENLEFPKLMLLNTVYEASNPAELKVSKIHAW
jgi:hypothetical protein